MELNPKAVDEYQGLYTTRWYFFMDTELHFTATAIFFLYFSVYIAAFIRSSGREKRMWTHRILFSRAYSLLRHKLVNPARKKLAN